MNENFLHYIWQFQYFDKADLVTTDGDEVHIFNPGKRNIHSGPDFFNARVKIGDMQWSGSVEIHIQSSGWLAHHHESDKAYENVVLHVVWKDDKPIHRSDGTKLPCIELKNRIEERLLLNCRKLVNSPEQIPCGNVLENIQSVYRTSALDKALASRLESKSDMVLQLYERNNHDWQETCYQVMLRNFGFKINSDPFQQLALALPYKLLLKHGDKLLHVEALLFGQAGFLEKEKGDDYFQLLKREYRLLSTKYQLGEKKLSNEQWRFLRLRPANFPTVRLAQLASVLFEHRSLFSIMIAAGTRAVLTNLFKGRQSSYWREHYRFSVKSKETVSFLGENSVDNILVNTVAPLLAAYARIKDSQEYMDRAIILLQEISAEQNSITKLWASHGMKSKSAFDSQAMIELYSNFCQKRRCLECTIGHAVLKSSDK